MIRQIRGNIAYITDTTIVIDVSGVGYLIHTNTENITLSSTKEVLFHTFMAVRENSLDLYGFLSLGELEMFELLLSLQKIGPKSALSIMRSADMTLLKQSIIKNDAVYLSKMSGIGKKTAEKIVSGLQDKFKDEHIEITPNTNMSDETEYASDTIDALIALGYTQNEARKTTQQVIKDYPDIKDPTALLKVVLKSLNN